MSDSWKKTQTFKGRIAHIDKEVWSAPTTKSYSSVPELIGYTVEELGEVAKEIRKIHLDPTRTAASIDAANFDLGLELADVLINVLLIAIKEDIDLWEATDYKLKKLESEFASRVWTGTFQPPQSDVTRAIIERAKKFGLKKKPRKHPKLKAKR